jgi:LPS sulfotransferase NodH
LAQIRHFLSRLSQSIRSGKENYLDLSISAESATPKTQDTLLEFIEGTGLLQFLLNRTAPCAILADEPLLQALQARRSGRRRAALYALSDLENKGITRPPAGPYYILTRGDEHAAKAKLRGLLADKGLKTEIRGVLNDVMPAACSGRSNGPGGFEGAWETYRAVPRYIILCAPRSGSEFLVRSLGSSGIGAPREHMTTQFGRLLRQVDGARAGGLDFIYWFVTLIHQASANGIFGTKIISHVHRSIEAALSKAEKQFLSTVMDGAHLVYLQRSNKLLQALSFDRALLTQFWHSYDPSHIESYRERADKWTYDFNRIANVIQYLRNEERYIHEVWKRHAGGRGMSICYETLDIDAIKQQLRAVLNVPEIVPGSELSTTLLRDQQTQDYAERFLHEYKARYAASDAKTHLPLRITLEGDALKIDPSPDTSASI